MRKNRSNVLRRRNAKKKKKNQREFRVEKAIERKDDKLYVTWKDYNSSFNSWTDKNGIK